MRRTSIWLTAGASCPASLISFRWWMPLSTTTIKGERGFEILIRDQRIWYSNFYHHPISGGGVDPGAGSGSHVSVENMAAIWIACGKSDSLQGLGCSWEPWSSRYPPVSHMAESGCAARSCGRHWQYTLPIVTYLSQPLTNPPIMAHTDALWYLVL